MKMLSKLCVPEKFQTYTYIHTYMECFSSLKYLKKKKKAEKCLTLFLKVHHKLFVKKLYPSNAHRNYALRSSFDPPNFSLLISIFGVVSLIPRVSYWLLAAQLPPTYLHSIFTESSKWGKRDFQQLNCFIRCPTSCNLLLEPQVFQTVYGYVCIDSVFKLVSVVLFIDDNIHSTLVFKGKLLKDASSEYSAPNCNQFQTQRSLEYLFLLFIAPEENNVFTAF